MYKELYVVDGFDNMVEELVFGHLHQVIRDKSVDFCTCEICVQDIAAITLNNVPAKYVTSFLEKTSPREHYKQELDSLHAQVVEQLPAAIEQVKKKAHH